MNFGFASTHKRNLTIVAVMVLMTLCFIVFQSADAYAATAKEIDVSVDVALENFDKHVKGGKEFLKSAKGVLVLPGVFKAGVGIGGEYGEGALRIAGKTVSTEENHNSGFYAARGPEKIPGQFRLGGWRGRLCCSN